jgi:bisphosphoglycerate-dependent phosphoglycerate mutase
MSLFSAEKASAVAKATAEEYKKAREVIKATEEEYGKVIDATLHLFIKKIMKAAAKGKNYIIVVGLHNDQAERLRQYGYGVSNQNVAVIYYYNTAIQVISWR